MVEELHDIGLLALAFSELLGRQFLKVLAYPVMPKTRIYWLYLATSLLLAVLVYVRAKLQQNTSARNTTLFRFLFPKDVWENPSAWLDVRYFFFHQIVRLVIYGSFVSFISVLVFQHTSEWLGYVAGEGNILRPSSIGPIGVVYALISIAALDFTSFAIHYLQHKVPFLWEFHKVHHSATVLHPLTNYREHPIDNLFYAVGNGICLGLMASTVPALIGYIPKTPTVFGIGIFLFTFNALGYNLRHSHIWLRWPGNLTYVFGSPAHHQVHHSYHPEHIDKNFAFVFPVWDVIFGTYCVPEDNRDVRFGLGENQKNEYESCLDLYFVPMKNAFLYLFPSLDNQTDCTDTGSGK